MSVLTARELRVLLRTVPDGAPVLIGGVECGLVLHDQGALSFEDTWSGTETLEATRARGNAPVVLWRSEEGV